jgi:hypothetical protein
MARLNLHSTRAIVWTVVLALLIAVEIYAKYSWLSLVIPATILMWYGLLAEPRGKIAVQKHTGGTLH